MQKVVYMGKSHGNSMVPLINTGDKILIKRVDGAKDISIGDIIIFYNKGRLINHRVISKKDNGIIAKGDNSLFIDPPLEFDKILGKVVKIDGRYGIINLDSRIALFLKYYFLFYSLSAYYAPRLAYRIAYSLRGRRFLTKFLQKIS